MLLKMLWSVLVMLLSAAALCRQAAATNPPVKRTKLVTVTGVQPDKWSTTSPKTFKLPVFQNTKFSFASSCNHCLDSTLTVKAGAKGAPVITFTAPANDPWYYNTTVTITTSPPAVTVIQTTNSFVVNPKEIYRFRADIGLLKTEDVWFAWSRRAALDSLNTVATNAATFITFKQHYSGLPFPYSPDMHLVVAYLKHLAAASKG